jgi:hypothetical protein
MSLTEIVNGKRDWTKEGKQVIQNILSWGMDKGNYMMLEDILTLELEKTDFSKKVLCGDGKRKAIWESEWGCLIYLDLDMETEVDSTFHVSLLNYRGFDSTNILDLWGLIRQTWVWKQKNDAWENR